MSTLIMQPRKPRKEIDPAIRYGGSMRTIDCASCGASFKGHNRGWWCDTCRPFARARAEAARLVVRKLVKAGELQPATDFPCVDCGRRADGYDHRDYRLAAVVEPVCHSCNMKRGPARW